MAEELWALRVGVSISTSESWSGEQGPGHRARPAAVGDGMGEEIGRLVPCTAAGSWLMRRRTIPEEAGGPEAAVRNGGEEGPWWTASPQPCLPSRHAQMGSCRAAGGAVSNSP